jgi:hypothetical protein
MECLNKLINFSIYLDIELQISNKMVLFLIVLFFSILINSAGSYILFPENVNFLQAVAKCDSINAKVFLAENKTEEDFVINNFVNNALVTIGIWIAIYDINPSGSENNVNYYTNQTLLYTNWMTGEPNYKDEACTIISKLDSYKWLDNRCSNQYSVLCKPLETTIISSTNSLNLVTFGRYYSIIENADTNTTSFLISNLTISSKFLCLVECNSRNNCLSLIFIMVKNNNCFLYSKKLATIDLIGSNSSSVFIKNI